MKNLILFVLHLIRKIISVILNHAIPRQPKPNHPSFRTAYDRYKEAEVRRSYNHFKKYFPNAMFLDDCRAYAISKAISNHKPGYFYLEFGVASGDSLNQFSDELKDEEIYGFDSFEGLREDWVGNSFPKESFSRNKKPPLLNKNCVLVTGVIQDTLPKFISKNNDLNIQFVHIDVDTYPTTKFILQQIKPYLANNSIIIFDELYDFPGWSISEYKALIEEFNEEEYKFLAFATRGGSAVIQYQKL
jgi:hypothetical protein